MRKVVSCLACDVALAMGPRRSPLMLCALGQPLITCLTISGALWPIHFPFGILSEPRFDLPFDKRLSAQVSRLEPRNIATLHQRTTHYATLRESLRDYILRLEHIEAVGVCADNVPSTERERRD